VFFSIGPPGTKDDEALTGAATPTIIADLGRGQMEADNPGMHTSDTIDFEVVLSGEIGLELDDGVEKVLRAGDCVVQNGTRHRWHNRGTDRAMFVSILIGSNPRPDLI
jgi:mannose-6-phosphate isomerase-like protein (cupin superfamily)